MPKLPVPKPPDPRPSKAHPVHRARRKELEKKHGGYEWVPYLGLALTGLVLAFNVEKDVEKCEKRKEGGERERESDDDDGGRRDKGRRRGESSRRAGRGGGSRDGDKRDGREGEGRGRGRGRSLDREYDRERRYRGREDGGYGRDDGDGGMRRLEGRPRDYEYYGGGRAGYEPWDERRAYDRRSAW